MAVGDFLRYGRVRPSPLTIRSLAGRCPTTTSQTMGFVSVVRGQRVGAAGEEVGSL